MTETLSYSNPRRKATVENWPSGRHRVTARFWIESNSRGERVMRQTTGKPKASTYSPRCAIVDGSDGRTYFLQDARTFIGVMQGSMKYQQETVHRSDQPERYAALDALLAEART